MNVHSLVQPHVFQPFRAARSIAASKSFAPRWFASPSAAFTRPACTTSAPRPGSVSGSSIAISKTKRRSSPRWRIDTRRRSRMSWNAPGRRRSLLESLEILVHRALLREFTEGAVGFRGRSLRGSVTQSAGGKSRARRLADRDGRADRLDRAGAGSESRLMILRPSEMAELIFAVGRGMLMRDVLQPPELTSEERRARQLEVTRGLWRLLFQPENTAAYA